MSSKISDFQKLNDVILTHVISLVRYFLLCICINAFLKTKFSQNFYNPVNFTYTYLFIAKIF